MRPKASVLDLITATAVVLGVLYGALELRGFRQTRERDSVLELHRTIQTPEYVRAINVLLAVSDSATIEELRAIRFGPDRDAILQLFLTWESLGIMVFRRDIPIEWVDEFHRFGIITTWRKFGPHLLDERRRVNYAGIGEWTQWLAERLQERERAAQVPAYERHKDWKP